MRRIRIGFVAAVQPSFWGSSRNDFQRHYLPCLEKLAAELDFDLHAIREPLVTKEDAVKALEELLDGEIDFLLIQLATFAGGEVIEVLAGAGIRLGLWGVPEITDTGAIPLNSFCGLNMYSSIIGQYLDKNTKFKWFYGDVTDELFIDRFKVTVKALTALKNLYGARIALVGGIAPGFNNLYYDERKTLGRLGVKVERRHEFAEIKERALSYSHDEISGIVARMIEESSRVTEEAARDLERTARVYQAFADFIEENGYAAVAIGCWPKYRQELGITVCSAIGRLLDKGYIAACEGDVDGAISMMLLSSLAGQAPMLMDMSRVDLANEAVLMWHCGSAPRCYADGNGMCLAGHYKPGSRIAGADAIKVGTVGEMYFKAGGITVARLTWDYENMLVLTGEFIDREDKSFDGSRGWVAKIKMDGRRVPLKDLINTLMVRRFQHHYPIVAGDVAKELMEVMAWLDIKPLMLKEYRDSMQNNVD